jgi:hypothetical protein
VIADLISYRQGLSQVGVDADSANNLRAVAALSQAVESLGLMQVAVTQTADAGRLGLRIPQACLGSSWPRWCRLGRGGRQRVTGMECKDDHDV